MQAFRVKPIVLAFCLLLLNSSLAFADTPRFRAASNVLPYPEEIGYLSISATLFSSTTEYAPSGDTRELFSAAEVTDAQISETTVNFHYEKALESWLTLVVDLGYRTFTLTYSDLFVRPTDPERNVTIESDAFSDLWVSGRLGLLKARTWLGPWLSSMQLGVKLPTGDVTSAVPTGTGFIDYELRSLNQFDFRMLNSPAKLYTNFAYQLRGGEFDNQIHYRAELNLYVARELIVKSSYGGIAAPDNATTPIGMDDDRNLIFVGDEAYTQYSLGLEFSFSSSFSVNFDYISRISGTNTFSGNQYNIGVAFK
jgi:hypothetical protein